MIFDTLYQNFTFASRALVHMISQLGACHSGECWRHISYDYVQKTLIAYEFLWHRSARSNLLTFSRATAKSFTPISARAIDFHFNEPPGRISFTNGKSSQFHQLGPGCPSLQPWGGMGLPYLGLRHRGTFCLNDFRFSTHQLE